MTRRRAARPTPPSSTSQAALYPLHASITDLAQLLRRPDLSPWLRAQVVDHLKRDRYETAEQYVARLGDLVDDVGNIGDIRRGLFMPWDSAWNAYVRDETAARERPATSGEAK